MTADQVEKALRLLGFDDFGISANNPLVPLSWGHDKPFPTEAQLAAALAPKPKKGTEDA